ncbi:hypothetical protein VIGAN_04152500, partial [Vigna angularis var. angularis]
MRNNIIIEGGQLRYDNPMTATPIDIADGSSDVLVRTPATVSRKADHETNKLNSTVERITKKEKSVLRKLVTEHQYNKLQSQEVVEYGTLPYQQSQLSEVVPVEFWSLLS